jgi:hypothetical protein
MFAKRALGVGLLALTGVAVAQQGLRSPQVNKVQVPGANESQVAGRTYADAELAAVRAAAAAVEAKVQIARRPSPKKPTALLRIPHDATGRVFFKVTDEYQALLQGDGTLVSVANRDLDPIQQVVAQFGMTMKPAITKDPQRLIALQERATTYSGKGQPWLGGMLIMEGPRGRLLAAARALNNLDAVEWVDVETERSVGQGGNLGACCQWPLGGACLEDVTFEQCTSVPGNQFLGVGSTCGGPACGACCTLVLSCVMTSPDGCTGLAPPLGPGMFIGGDCVDVACDELDDPDCGVAGTGDCFDPDGNGSAYCDETACCTRVCDFDPWCCDIDGGGWWDSICASAANQLCIDADHCTSPISGDCFDSSPCDAGGRQVGCDNADCCNEVCSVKALCCDDVIGCWDDECVALAIELCEPDPVGPATPDYTDLQGYLSAAPYSPVPPELGLPVANGVPFIGFTGEGFNLMEGEPFEDLNSSGSWDPGEPFTDWNGNTTYDPGDPYGGLYGLGQQLLEEFGIDATGEGNLTLGKTIKVAVIEWGYWEGHEDLNVTTEPGQTILPIPSVTAPDHGTACLSIINAIPNGIGMTGIAPEAEAYFFPLTSVEEGAREINAWASATELLGPGDVISASYGPGPELGQCLLQPRRRARCRRQRRDRRRRLLARRAVVPPALQQLLPAAR